MKARRLLHPVVATCLTAPVFVFFHYFWILWKFNFFFIYNFSVSVSNSDNIYITLLKPNSKLNLWYSVICPPLQVYYPTIRWQLTLGLGFKYNLRKKENKMTHVCVKCHSITKTCAECMRRCNQKDESSHFMCSTPQMPPHHLADNLEVILW